MLGPDHPDTLRTRSNVALYAGQGGDPGEAVRLLRDLLPDLERVLGPDHSDTVATQKWIEALSYRT